VFIVFQLLIIGSVVAGFLATLVRSLLCKTQNEACGKVVLITGCDTGIGHEVAAHLDHLGCHVFAGCLDTASEGAQRLRVEASPNLKLIKMDVTSDEQVAMAVKYVEDNLPQGEEGLYALINNAGVCVCGEFDWQTMEHIETQVSVNILGTMRVTKQFLHLLKNCKGRILNVSSVAGMYGYPGLSVYCTTKHGMEGFSQVLRMELAKFNVHVVNIQPGDFSKATHLLNDNHRNMNRMWADMTEEGREEYKQYFVAYHDNVARSGFTGYRLKPVSALPPFFIRGFQEALLTKMPDKTYLFMPTWRSRMKILALSFLPVKWSQQLLSKRYNDSVPQVVLSRGKETQNIVNKI